MPKICGTCGRSWRRAEVEINKLVAQAGSVDDDAVREALIKGVWGPHQRTQCHQTVMTIEHRTVGADWTLTCTTCTQVHAIAEHKPHGAPVQWSRATPADYLSAGPPGPWLAALPPTCENDHSPCDSDHPYKWADRRKRRIYLAAPQLLVYSNAHAGMAVTLVTDRQGDAERIYQSARYVRMSATRFPIRTTAAVINDLYRALPKTITPSSLDLLRAAATALWFRAPWHVDNTIDPAAKPFLIDGDAVTCAEMH